MGQVLQTNGDYTIKTADEGTIRLDTGAGVGNVRVTGNLLVDGETLTVSAENLNVQDNIITLNYGEEGNGVSLEYSGIQVDRGTASNYDGLFLLDDRDPAEPRWLLGNGSPVGTISFAHSNLKLRRIWTDPDTETGNLTLIGVSSPQGVVHVSGTINYEAQVRDFGDDAIPNKKYVDDAIQSNPTFQIVRGDTRVVSFDKDDPLDTLLYFPPEVGPYTSQPPTSLVSVVVDGTINSVFYNNRALIQGLEVTGTEIVNDDTNTNIFIRTNGTGKLETNYALQLDNISVTPASVLDSTLVYGAAPGLATTGVYFVNSERSGELINKNKALLFSMIF